MVKQKKASPDGEALVILCNTISGSSVRRVKGGEYELYCTDCTVESDDIDMLVVTTHDSADYRCKYTEMKAGWLQAGLTCHNLCLNGLKRTSLLFNFDLLHFHPNAGSLLVSDETGWHNEHIVPYFDHFPTRSFPIPE